MATLTVEEFIKLQGKELRLSLVAGKEGLDREIRSPQIQKPGLILTGFISDIKSDRIQVFGLSEIRYLNSLPESHKVNLLKHLASLPIPCVIVTRGLRIPRVLRDFAEDSRIPLLRSTLTSAVFIDKVLKFLEDRLAPSTLFHGVLVDVLGIGILIFGKSGIGKSECALDLVSRGYRLVADDVVEIWRREPSTLFGRGKGVIKYHMEVRGLGIINIKDIFGITAIREKKQIDLAVELIEWNPEEDYERIGFEKETITILDVKLPLLRIPVCPGRSVATIIEVAARNHILKIMGRDAAREFMDELDRAIRINRRKIEKGREEG